MKNSTHIQLYEKAVKIYLANQFMIVKKIIENPHNKQVVLYNISVHAYNPKNSPEALLSIDLVRIAALNIKELKSNNVFQFQHYHTTLRSKNMPLDLGFFVQK